MEAEVSPAALRAFRRAAQQPRSPAGDGHCGEEACVYEEAEAHACGAWVPFSWEERPGVPLLVDAFTQSHATLEAMRWKRERSVHDPQPQQSPFAPPSEHASSRVMLFPLPPPPTPLRRTPPHNAHASSSPAAALAPDLHKRSSDQPPLPSSPLSFPRRHRASSFPPFLDLPSAAASPTPKSSVWAPIPSALEDDPFLRAIQACTQSADCSDEPEEHSNLSTGAPKGRSRAIAGSKEAVDLTTHIKHRNAAHLRALAKDAGMNGADAARSGAMRGARDNAESSGMSESYGGSTALLGSLVEEPQQRKGGTKGKLYEGHPAFVVANIQQAHAKPRAKEARRHQRRSTSSNLGWSCRNVNYHDSIVRIQNPRVFSSPAP